MSQLSLFSPTAGADQSRELVPDGTLARGIISLSEKNPLANSQTTGGQYANLVITLDGGPGIRGKKIFHMLADPTDTDNSEAWRKMGISAITRMLEACGVFVDTNPESYKIFDREGITFNDMLEYLVGQAIAVEVGIQAGKDGYDDKNVIKTFLTPSSEKTSKRGRQLWDLFLSGATTSKVDKPKTVLVPSKPGAIQPKPGLLGKALAGAPGSGFATPSAVAGPKTLKWIKKAPETTPDGEANAASSDPAETVDSGG